MKYMSGVVMAPTNMTQKVLTTAADNEATDATLERRTRKERVNKWLETNRHKFTLPSDGTNEWYDLSSSELDKGAEDKEEESEEGEHEQGKKKALEKEPGEVYQDGEGLRRGEQAEERPPNEDSQRVQQKRNKEGLEVEQREVSNLDPREEHAPLVWTYEDGVGERRDTGYKDDEGSWSVGDDSDNPEPRYTTSEEKHKGQARAREFVRIGDSTPGTHGYNIPTEGGTLGELESEDDEEPRVETEISTHEEIIRLIRSGGRNTAWETFRDKELDRIEEGNSRWNAMQSQWQEEETLPVDDGIGDTGQSPNLSDKEENPPKTSRKRKAKEEGIPVIEEQVFRRSQRAKRLTYKASQPEYMRLMRKTTMSSERSRYLETADKPRKRRTVVSLMAQATRIQSVSGKDPSDRQKGARIFNDRNRKDDGKAQQTTNQRKIELMDDATAWVENGEHRLSEGNSLGLSIEFDVEGLSNPQDRMNICASDESETEGLWAKGNEEQERIKGRTVRGENLTQLDELDRYWFNGRLRPHTSLYFEPSRMVDLSLHATSVASVPFPVRSPFDEEHGTPTLQQALYPTTGLIAQWPGLVLVGTEVLDVKRRNLPGDRYQTEVRALGATIVGFDPVEKKKFYFTGGVTLLFNGEKNWYPLHEPFVPRPNPPAMDVLWGGIFHPQGPSVISTHGNFITPSGVSKYSKYFMGRLTDDDPKNRAVQRVTRGTGTGAPNDPIDVDRWVAALEASGVDADGPTRSSAPAESEISPPGVVPSGPGSERVVDKEAVEEEAVSTEAEKTVQNGKRVRERVTQQRMGDLPRLKQKLASIFEEYSDSDSESSSVSSSDEDEDMFDLEVEELLLPPRPTNPQLVSPTLTSLSTDTRMTYETDLTSNLEVLDAGVDRELEEFVLGEGTRAVFHVATDGEREQSYGIPTVPLPSITPDDNVPPLDLNDIAAGRFYWKQRQQERSVPSPPLEPRVPAYPPRAPSPNALPLPPYTFEVPPPSPLSATPESLPSLISMAEDTASLFPPGWEASLNQGREEVRRAWDNSVYATAEQVNELVRQVNDMEHKIVTHLVEPVSENEPWKAPYTTWKAHAALGCRVQDLASQLQQVQSLVDTYQAGFEAYQKELGEQLDKRFRGLRDTQGQRIKGTEDWVLRVEDRVMKAEVQSLWHADRIAESSAAIQSHPAAHAHGKADSCGPIAAHNSVRIAKIEAQLKVLSEVYLVPDADGGMSGGDEAEEAGVRSLRKKERSPKIVRRGDPRTNLKYKKQAAGAP
jgi:hypothetical protein